MEFKDNIRLIKRSRYFIIVFTILVVVLTVLFGYTRSTTYVSSISFGVNRINKHETQYYDDSYYGIQAADLFSQTVISWFMTPSVLLEIYEKAGVDPKITTIERFTSQFKTKKYSAQNIVVKFTERDRKTAEKISDAIVSIVENKASDLNRSFEDKALFEIVGTKPVIVENTTNIPLVGGVGAVIGFIFSLILVFLREYFRDSRQQAKGPAENEPKN